MRYFNRNASNVLGLKNMNTGNQLKAGDQTVLQYRLTDSNNDVLNLQGEQADVYLKKDRKTTQIASTVVTDDLEVHFQMKNVLDPGVYALEIVVGDQYFFPSDNSEQIIVFESYLSLINQAIKDIIDKGESSIDELKQYISNLVKNELEKLNTTYIAGENVTIKDNVISAVDEELREAVANKQDTLFAGENISINEDGVISAVDSDTVYDDTELRQLIEDSVNGYTGGENVTISDDGVISAVDTDTVYDDTVINQRLDAVQQHIDELVRGDIDMQEFIDRLSTLEADMRTIKQRGAVLREDVEAIELAFDDIENVELSEIRTALEAVQLDIEQLQQGVSDTTLALEVEALQSTVSDLSAKVTALMNDEPVPVDPDLQAVLDDIIADIRHLEDALADEAPIEYDDAELRARIEALEAEIVSIVADGSYDDTALKAQVDALATELAVLEEYVSTDLQPIVDQLNDSLASVSELEDAVLVTIPADIAELKAQVDALNEHISEIATEYSIRELIGRVEDIENLTYHFEGQSEDVINFITENSVKALRFNGEGLYDPANLYNHADEQYGYNEEADFLYFTSYYNDLTGMLEGGFDGLEQYVDHNTVSKLPYEGEKVRIMRTPSSRFYKESMDLSDKVLSFRLNPSYYDSSPDPDVFTPVDSMDVYVFIKDYMDNNGSVFDYYLKVPYTTINESFGQFQLTMPSDYTFIHIIPLSGTNGEPTVNSRPLTNPDALGLWVIEDAEEDGGDNGDGGDDSNPDSIGTLTIEPVVGPYGYNNTNSGISASEYVTYEGDGDLVGVFASTPGYPLDTGIHNLMYADVPLNLPDGSSFEVGVYIPIVVGEPGQAVEDIEHPDPITVNITPDMNGETLDPFIGVRPEHTDHTDYPGIAIPDPIGDLSVTPITTSEEVMAEYAGRTGNPVPAELLIGDHVTYNGDLEFSWASEGNYTDNAILDGEPIPPEVNIRLFFTNNRFDPALEYKYTLGIPVHIEDDDGTGGDSGDDTYDPDDLGEEVIVGEDLGDNYEYIGP